MKTRETIISEFNRIRDMGWIENKFNKAPRAVGMTFENLLGIKENNLPLPDIGEYELKCQRVKIIPSSLLTLFRLEPEPRDFKMAGYLVENFGWKPLKWRSNYSQNELSFRQTINGLSYSDRGFKVNVNRDEDRVEVHFNKDRIDQKHESWSNSLPEFTTIPYWPFEMLKNKLENKLTNCFYVIACTKSDQSGKESYKYGDITELRDVNFDRFLEQIERGNVLVEFSARTGHNHGTGFRIRQNRVENLYETVNCIL